ncbi:UDP-4-amino-4,6-dideoxy-N-acetyl-beta-L-altrosamine transaminase [Sphingomonas sp. CJ20]
MIPYGRQSISEADIAAVVDVLRSDWLTQGPMVPRFEQAVADRCGAHHAVAMSSATAALHVACLALGLGRGDWLWTTPITFVASANCALYCGARVDFVDIDPRTYNLCPTALARKLAQARIDGRLPKVVVPVALCGQSCDMAAIRALADEYGFAILEDASHAIGGRYGRERVGGCRYSDITVFSFHPVKIITTGEGGMALTNYPALAERMALLRSHGITRDPVQMQKAPDGPWYYEQVDLGFNYRMTDMQAALGLSQLDRLDEWVALRTGIANRYDRLLADLPVMTPWRAPDVDSAFHLYVVRVGADVHGAVFRHLRQVGVGANLHYIPVHTQPYYRAMGFAPGDFPEAEAYYREAISLPMFPTLREQQQDVVVAALRMAVRSAVAA